MAGSSSSGKIALVVAFYFAVSLALVFVNKQMLTSMNMPFPAFLTWTQILVTIALLGALSLFRERAAWLSFVPVFEYDLAVARQVLPLAVVFVMMVVLNNLCLQYVELSFYQVARSLTIVFSIVFTYVLLHTRTSLSALLACAVVFGGFVLASLTEVQFSLSGLVFGVSSSAFVALNAIYVKKIGGAVLAGDTWKLMLYTNTTALVLLIPVFVLLGELPAIRASTVLWSRDGAVVVLVSGILGFLINIATYLQIAHTSPLTNNIVGTVKACVQTILAVVLFGNVVPAMNALGIFLTILGSFAYSYIRYLEMEEEKVAKQRAEAATAAAEEGANRPGEAVDNSRR